MKLGILLSTLIGLFEFIKSQKLVNIYGQLVFECNNESNIDRISEKQKYLIETRFESIENNQYKVE